MAKIQRQYVRGKVYLVEGVSERQRKLKFVGLLKLSNWKEYLVFQPLRKVSKYHKSR